MRGGRPLRRRARYWIRLKHTQLVALAFASSGRPNFNAVGASGRHRETQLSSFRTPAAIEVSDRSLQSLARRMRRPAP